MVIVGISPGDMISSSLISLPEPVAGPSTKEWRLFILLVEDERLIREIMSESLQDAGHEVVEAETGVQAMAMLNRSQARPDILVTDFHMPGGLDGGQVAGRVREVCPGIPVVIASGRPDAMQPAWRSDLGYTFLRKPYLPSELIRLVDALAAFRDG